MKYNIQIEQNDEKGKVIPIEETKKMIEIEGEVREFHKDN